MGVNIGSSFSHEVDITDIDGFPTTYTMNTNVNGIPTSYDIDTTLNGIPDTYHIDVTNLPKIQLSIDPLEIKPIDVSLRLKEIPSIRGHLPADFCVGFSLFGVEIAKLRLCGEAQVITEPYTPNPCEVCTPRRGEQVLDMLQQTASTVAAKGSE
jgi:hypothetical protein